MLKEINDNLPSRDAHFVPAVKSMVLVPFGNEYHRFFLPSSPSFSFPLLTSPSPVPRSPASPRTKRNSKSSMLTLETMTLSLKVRFFPVPVNLRLIKLLLLLLRLSWLMCSLLCWRRSLDMVCFVFLSKNYFHSYLLHTPSRRRLQPQGLGLGP